MGKVELFRNLPSTGAFISDARDIEPYSEDMLILRSGARMTCLPFYDRKAALFARLGHGPAAFFLRTRGMRLPTIAESQEHHEACVARGLFIPPFTLPGDLLEVLKELGLPENKAGYTTFYAKHMRSHRMCSIHDAYVLELLRAMKYVTGPVSNVGKHWTLPVGMIFGWWRLNGSRIQNPSMFHAKEPNYTDYATNFHGVVDGEILLVETEPMTITRVLKKGMSGEDVRWLQEKIGTKADSAFGPKTEAVLKTWQEAHGLVADGIAGERTVKAAGGEWKLPNWVDMRSPACLAALRDATAMWPERNKISDGIMGDARHQASKSDHNIGNAVDITHDEESGCTGDYIARLAITDPRTQYVIWDHQIWNVDRREEGWRKYTGSNPHTHHVHISVKAIMREDDRLWSWAMEGNK